MARMRALLVTTARWRLALSIVGLGLVGKDSDLLGLYLGSSSLLLGKKEPVGGTCYLQYNQAVLEPKTAQSSFSFGGCNNGQDEGYRRCRLSDRAAVR